MNRFMRGGAATVFASLLTIAGTRDSTVLAQGRIAAARNIRCSFTLRVTASWKPDGTPDAVTSPVRLTLLFESIDTDQGTARLRSGSVFSEVAARSSSGYLTFMQMFRTGPLYTTTVFERETKAGRFRAVHSRHESFAVPLPDATSSPEQYYGECEIRE